MKSLLTTITTGFRHNDKPVVTKVFVEEETDSIKQTVKTGYDDTEIVKPPTPKEIEEATSSEKFEESVKDNIDTGFGDGTLNKECPGPKIVEYLEQSNHLSEFRTDTDKLLARQNLGVYSTSEVQKLLNDITNNVGNLYVTKSEVQTMISQIDFVDSILKSYANYEVPNNLFRI